MSDLELRSQLYAFLGDRTSNPDGDAWDHDRLRVLVSDLLPVVDRIANERAAAELRAVAKAIRWDGLLQAADYAGYAAQLVDVRADELDPT